MFFFHRGWFIEGGTTCVREATKKTRLASGLNQNFVASCNELYASSFSPKTHTALPLLIPCRSHDSLCTVRFCSLSVGVHLFGPTDENILFLTSMGIGTVAQCRCTMKTCAVFLLWPHHVKTSNWPNSPHRAQLHAYSFQGWCRNCETHKDFSHWVFQLYAWTTTQSKGTRQSETTQGNILEGQCSSGEIYWDSPLLPRDSIWPFKFLDNFPALRSFGPLFWAK